MKRARMCVCAATAIVAAGVFVLQVTGSPTGEKKSESRAILKCKRGRVLLKIMKTSFDVDEGFKLQTIIPKAFGSARPEHFLGGTFLQLPDEAFCGIRPRRVRFS